MNFLYLQLMGASSFLKAKALIEKPGSPIALHDSCLAQSRVGVPFKKFHPKNHIQKKKHKHKYTQFFQFLQHLPTESYFHPMWHPSTSIWQIPPCLWHQRTRVLNPNISMYDLPWEKLSTHHRWVSPVGILQGSMFFGLKSVKYIVSHVNVYNISSIYGVFTLLGLPEQKSANL